MENTEQKLVVNRWKTPDGTILQSKYHHDYQSHIDKNGDTYFVDGGIDYTRMSFNDEPMVDLCLYYPKDDFEEIRKYFMRGTFDEDGNQCWIALCDMSNAHVANCIKYNEEHSFGDSVANKLYAKELEYRKAHKINREGNQNKYTAVGRKPKTRRCTRKYTIECTEEQLRLISHAVEDYTRFLSGQCEMNNAMMLTDACRIGSELENELHKIVTPELPQNASYGWSGSDCPNFHQRREIAMGYGIYREILHYFAMKAPYEGWNVYKSETLTCPEQGPLITIKEKEE